MAVGLTAAATGALGMPTLRPELETAFSNSRRAQASSPHTIGGSAGARGVLAASGLNPNEASRPLTMRGTVTGAVTAAGAATLAGAASAVGATWRVVTGLVCAAAGGSAATVVTACCCTSVIGAAVRWLIVGLAGVGTTDADRSSAVRELLADTRWDLTDGSIGCSVVAPAAEPASCCVSAAGTAVDVGAAGVLAAEGVPDVVELVCEAPVLTTPVPVECEAGSDDVAVVPERVVVDLVVELVVAEADVEGDVEDECEVGDSVEFDAVEADLDSDPVLGELVEEDEPADDGVECVGSAHATPHPVATAAPTPKATASPPTRPT